MFKQRKQCLLCIMLAVIALVFPLLVQAAEITFPVAAYTGEELAKVRAWEKTWAGKKIDKNNIDQVAEFLPESYVGAYREPEKWGAPSDNYFFYIIPYKRYTETTGMLAATKKYAPQGKVASDGWLENYTEIAGMPFPNPKTVFPFSV